MKNQIKPIGMLLLFGASIPMLTAGENHPAETRSSTEIAFPQEVKELITQEMQALQQGMHEIVPAIVSGDWEQLEKTGRQMRDSYIMKQQLTKAQKQALQASLPKRFKEVDRDFHRSTEMLSKAAEQRDMEMVIFHYSKITAACVNCHSQYATQRFPALATTQPVTNAIMSECSSIRQLAIALAGGDPSEICGESTGEEHAEEEY